MNHKRLFIVVVIIFAGLFLLFSPLVIGAKQTNSYLSASEGSTLGSAFTYQGSLTDGGTPANGSYDFYFELFDAEIAGTSIMTTTNGDVDVADGLFTVLLEFDSSAFNGEARWLQISVRPGAETGPYTPLDDRQQITAAPYALYAVEADTLDGLHASEIGNNYQNVVVVAKSGGDYSSVQTAIDSITDAATDHPYLVWLAPGVYSETVTMKPYIHLRGAGRETTVITSTATSSWPPTQATLILANNSSLRDLTVGNSGMGEHNIALLSSTGMTQTRVADVQIKSQGVGEKNYAIALIHKETSIIFEQVDALSENATTSNVGLYISQGSTAKLEAGSFTGRGGNNEAHGIVCLDKGTKLDFDHITAVGENGGLNNFGLLNNNEASVVGHRSSLTGRGGTNAYGISNNNLEAIVNLDSVNALAENGSDGNWGLYNYNGADAVLNDGSYTGRGGSEAYGIYSYSESTLVAEGLTAKGEYGSDLNIGLYNLFSAPATLHASIFVGWGGTYAYGILNTDGGLLDADSIVVQAKDAIISNYGLFNRSGGAVVIRTGSFTAERGDEAYGIYNVNPDTRFEGERISALGINAASLNAGLFNHDFSKISIHAGTFTGSGGEYAYGLYNYDNSEMENIEVEVEGIVALGENASNHNYGFNNYAGGVVMRTSSCLGTGGVNSTGIFNTGSLEADRVTVLAEGASSNNWGLSHSQGAVGILRGGSFIGRGGVVTHGIIAAGNDTELEAHNITAIGENGTTHNYGFRSNFSGTSEITLSSLEGGTNPIKNDGGSVTVSSSRLGAVSVDVAVTCVAVTQGTIFYENSCP